MTTIADEQAALRQMVAADQTLAVQRKLRSGIDSRMRKAEAILAEAGDRPLSNAEYGQSRSFVEKAGSDAALLRSVREVEAERRQAAAVTCSALPGLVDEVIVHDTRSTDSKGDRYFRPWHRHE